MRNVFGFGVVGMLAVLGCGVCFGEGEKVEVKATEPASLAVVVGGVKLEVKLPELREGSAKGKVPANYNAEIFERWDPWPGALKGQPANSVSLSPRKDENNISILGGLFREFVPESVVVTTADGSKTFKMGEDYKFNERWGQVSNLEGRLGKPGEGELAITFKFATQRLDLVQVDASGKASLKEGKGAMVCPALPEADAGCRAVAGIYVKPWNEGGNWVVSAGDIYPIEAVEAVGPINAKAVSGTKKKMMEGKEVKIAFLGDSITLGAEAGLWWNDMWTEKSEAYVSRFVVGLRKKYPTATVTPIAAFKGGITTKAAAAFMEKDVLPVKPDLVVIAFGLNDASGAVGGQPTNPPESYKADILALIKAAKAGGSEVLLVTPFQGSPFVKSGCGQRIPEYRKGLLELSKEEDVACADVYTEWMNQAKRGVPPFSQVHNWINHPGPRGHALYAGVLLRVFD